MTGDVDEEVGGDNDENALDWGDGAAWWWDSHCENAVSSDFVKDCIQWGFICESSAIGTSAGTSGEVGVFRIREEQRELQGPKSKSGGTEVVMSPKTKFTKWECPGDGWKVWEAPDTTLEAEAHRYLACSAYTSPSKVCSVLGHEGRMLPLTIWPIRDQQSASVSWDYLTSAHLYAVRIMYKCALMHKKWN
jgi:hypothetical protein